MNLTTSPGKERKEDEIADYLRLRAQSKSSQSPSRKLKQAMMQAGLNY